MNKLFENIGLLIKQLDTKTEQKIARFLFNSSMTVSTAESCTGGLVSSRLTDIAGSSAYIKENFITYANEAKMELLGVSEETLKNHGAVSEECAYEMVRGLFDRMNSDGKNCDIALVTTGIAGPGGSTETKKVGLLYVAIKNQYSTKVKKFELDSNYSRKKMKFLFSQKALEFLYDFLKEVAQKKN